MSDSVRPHRRQPARLPHPWDSPGKNTGVGCHFLLQCMKGKSESEVAQSCLTLSDPIDCSPRGSSAHGIFQARVLEWVAIAFYKSPQKVAVRELCIKINNILLDQRTINIILSNEENFKEGLPWLSKVKTPSFHLAGTSLVPGRRTEIPYAL